MGNELATELIVDNLYRIKDSLRFKITKSDLRYMGEIHYQGVIYYEFWDLEKKMSRWVNKHDIEAVKEL